MARPLRVQYPGAVYHVTARGNDRRAIFEDDASRVHWVELLKAALETFEVELHAWVLLPNHYHLVVRTHRANLPQFMHHLNTAYTVWTNRKYRRTGHLFEGRYKAIVMQEDGYLRSVTVYVCLNPARVRSVRGLPLGEKLALLKRHVWGSYAEYALGRSAERWPSVSCEAVWGDLGGASQRDGQKQFRQHVAGWMEADRLRHEKAPDQADLDSNPLRDVGLQTYLGDASFRDFIQDLLGDAEDLDDAIIGAGAWHPYPSLTQVLDAGCTLLGLNRTGLSRRTRGDEKKALLLYLAQRSSRCGLRELGEVFGVTPAAISMRLRAFRDRLDADAHLAIRVQQQETSLSTYLKP